MEETMDVRSYRALDLTATISIPVGDFSRRLEDVIDRFLDYTVDHGYGSREDLGAALCDELGRLAGDPELAVAGDPSVTFTANVLGVALSAIEASETIEVTKAKLTALQYYDRFAEARVLISVLGRRSGIEAAKAYLDWVTNQRPPNPSGPETIAEMRSRDIPWNLDDKGQDAVSALLSENQCMKKVTACRTHQVLAHLEDREIAEAVACYPDHASIRRSNPHFVLTRTQTLIGGAPYCDTCFHDERYVPTFTHPGAEVFEALEYSDVA